MATALQSCQAINDALRLPAGTAEGAARRIRGQGCIASTQGRPEQISTGDIAKILIAVVTSSSVVEDYAAMRPVSGGPTFVEMLAEFIDEPNDLLELRIDAAAPGAVVSFRGADNGVQTVMFEPEDPQPRLAFRREVTLTPDVLIRLAASFAAMPEVKAGRPSNRNRYRRMEHAVVYKR